jgi:hypothetical protein
LSGQRSLRRAGSRIIQVLPIAATWIEVDHHFEELSELDALIERGLDWTGKIERRRAPDATGGASNNGGLAAQTARALSSFYVA